MDTVIPANFMGPNIAFTCVEDPEAHITAFHTEMMISGGTDAIHCKLFMGTFSDTTLDWFISLPDGHITSFDQFSTLFKEQFIVNQAPTPVSFDLFDVKQYQGEPLKDFLNRFDQCARDEESLTKRGNWSSGKRPRSCWRLAT